MPAIRALVVIAMIPAATIFSTKGRCDSPLFGWTMIASYLLVIAFSIREFSISSLA
jgi:hypothetical protein